MFKKLRYTLGYSFQVGGRESMRMAKATDGKVQTTPIQLDYIRIFKFSHNTLCMYRQIMLNRCNQNDSP